MPLPEAPRQRFERDPLAEVFAQLRFDSILLIDSKHPAEFQDMIRNNYPTYRVTVSLPPGMPPPVQRMIHELSPSEGFQQHTFGTEDAKWEVILTRELLVLKTKAYVGWEDFEARLQNMRSAFEAAYRPASNYISIHLRYIDIIQRSRIDLTNTAWSELLKPEVAGELASCELGDEIDKMANSLHCRLDSDGSFLTLKTSLALSRDGKNERCFVMDSDFHTHRRVESQNVSNTFRRFNRHSRNLFQWAIREPLRTALRPIS